MAWGPLPGSYTGLRGSFKYFFFQSSATRPSSVSRFSPAASVGEPVGRTSSSRGAPAGEPETRPRSSSFGKQYGPVRPTYLHDDTEELTSMVGYLSLISLISELFLSARFVTSVYIISFFFGFEQCLRSFIVKIFTCAVFL